MSILGFATLLSQVVRAAPLARALKKSAVKPTAPAPKAKSPMAASTEPAVAGEVVCLAKQKELTTESSESPFFQHFHQLSIPVVALLKPPAEGLTVSTSAMDQNSYDVDKFKEFINKSGMGSKKLSTHAHAVFISADQLARIAGGEPNVEIRVVSANGNYVHNFLVTATGSTLVKVRRYKDGKIQI